jgi:ABC-2 type transport system ATP-binding protein
MIEVDDVSHDYGRTRALDGVSFGIEPGEVVGLIGPNGAGKTTLLRAIATLLVPTRGRVRVGGRDVRSEARAVRGLVGYVPERAALYADLRVWEQLDFFAEVAGHAPAERRRRVSNALAHAGIADRADSLTRELSKGLSQRVAIQAALLHDPRVLVLDEPTDGLDPESRTIVLADVRRLADEGRAVLLSSHVLDEVEEVADRTLILVEGRLREGGTQPGKRFTIRLRGELERAREVLLGRAEIENVSITEGGLGVRLGPGVDDAADAAAALVAAGFALVELREENESLRERFHRVVSGESPS